MNRILLTVVASCYISVAHAQSADPRPDAPSSAARKASNEAAATASDVIARVGDQTITFSEINTALNSSAIVGVSVPALGTPERDTVRITLLDRFVSANLLYLDARKQGLDQDPVYQGKVQRFDNAILAGLYQRSQLSGDIPVTDAEIRNYHKNNVIEGTDLSPNLRDSIEAKLRRDKLHQRIAEVNARLRDGVEVKLHEAHFAPEGDADRGREVQVAEVDGAPITWGEIKDRLIAAGSAAVMTNPLASEEQARRQALQTEIDLRLMAQRARAAGLEADPRFRGRSSEYRKTLLTNMHRERLIAEMEPSDATLSAHYENHRDRFVVPQARKVQLVLVETREEAIDLSNRIEAGELTLYQAALNHSVAPGAGSNLGEIGWVYEGDSAPALDAALFTLGPGEISDPVETPNGWYLVKIQDVREAEHTDLNQPATRSLVRRAYLREQLDDYTRALRMNTFKVEVYQQQLVKLAQQEADMVAALARKAAEPGSVTEQRIKEMQQLAKPPL